MVTSTKQTMKVMNNDVNQTQNQTFFFNWTPTKVEKDKATIEQEIIGVIMDIEIGGSKISYDSTKDNAANNPLGDFFKALNGSKFTIELDLKNYKVDEDGRPRGVPQEAGGGQPADEAVARHDPQRGRPQGDGRADLQRRADQAGDQGREVAQEDLARHGPDRQVREHLHIHL